MGFEYSENRVGTHAGYQDAQNMRDTAAMFEARRGVDDALEQMYAATQAQPDVQAYTQPAEVTQESQYTPEQQASISKMLTNAADWIGHARADVTGKREG
jgi:hypothetical protein